MMHFSHPHELELWNPVLQGFVADENPSMLAVCSCCKFPVYDYEPMYLCMACRFFLHLGCSQFPQFVTHPSHKNHTLTLLPTAAYPGGAFNCDACNRKGDGFSYHCSSCEYDLHVICASKPLEIAHQFHPCRLELTFTNPYDNAKGFSCDVCHKLGYKEWLYRCGACEFDVHLDCAAARPPPAVQVQERPVVSSGGQSLVLPDHHHHQLIHNPSAGGNLTGQQQFQRENAAAPPVHGQVRRSNFVHTANTGQSASAGQSGLMSSLVVQGVQGTSQGAGQAFVQGMIDGQNNEVRSGDGGGN